MIVFIRSNPVVSDPRVEREVKSLTSYGFNVVVLAWDREGNFEHFESNSNDSCVFRFHLSAPYTTFAIAFYYPLFWFWCLTKLLKLKPELVHACDLDTIFPSLVYKFLIRNVKVIFDVFDTFTLLIQAKSKFLGMLVRPVELCAASKADALVVVSEERLHFFSCVALKQSEIIMNYPPVCSFSSICTDRNAIKKVFRVVYAGTIAPYRGLLEVAEAVSVLDNIEFMVAGRVIDRDIFARLCSFSCVKYVGQLSFDDSLSLERSADAIPVLYDQKLPINKIAAPNKLYEAMLVGVPVVTNLSGFLTKVPFGIQVEYDVDAIMCAIDYLQKNPEVAAKLGLEGRLAFEQKYNWSIVEKRLIDMYSQLLVSCK